MRRKNGGSVRRCMYQRAHEEELHERQHPQHDDEQVVVDVALEVGEADLDRGDDAQHDRDDHVLARAGCACSSTTARVISSGRDVATARVARRDELDPSVRLVFGDVGAWVSHVVEFLGHDADGDRGR